MKPYETIRLGHAPDIADIQSQARASHVGRLPEKAGVFKSYIRKSKVRKAVRRNLKRADRARIANQD
jgi:hypothetical protein